MNQFVGSSSVKRQLDVGFGLACLVVVLSSLVLSSWVLFIFPFAGAYIAIRKDPCNIIFAMMVLLIPVTLSSVFLSWSTVTAQLWLARILILIILPWMLLGSNARIRKDVPGVAFWSFALFGFYVVATTPFVSLYPSLSLQKALFFSCFILTLLYATRFGESNVRPMLGWIGSVIFSSVLFYFIYPSIGYAFTIYQISETDGRYSGIMGHPQTLAPVIAMSLPLIVYMVCLRKNSSGFLIWVGAFVCALVLLFLSSSRTGAVSAIFAIMLVSLLLSWRSQMNNVRYFARFFVFALVGFVAFVAPFKWDAVKSFAFKNQMGNELSLSGRDMIVEQSWNAFCQSPIVGNGFQVPSDAMNYGGENFDDGGTGTIEKSFFLTMLLEETGIIGFVLAMTGIISLYFAAWRRNALIFIATFSTFLLVNCGEATIFSPSGLGGLGWIICMATFRIRV